MRWEKFTLYLSGGVGLHKTQRIRVTQQRVPRSAIRSSPPLWLGCLPDFAHAVHAFSLAAYCRMSHCQNALEEREYNEYGPTLESTQSLELA